MEITLNTPALLFPAISLVLLAYTNRFLGLSSLVRTLHEKYLTNKENNNLHQQIKSLRYRIKLVRRMQLFGVLSFLSAIVCMFLIFKNELYAASLVFGVSLISFSISLIFSLVEITQSTKALEIELSDMEDIENNNLVDYIKNKFE
ncbi:MAG: DUF2721 domain-containing protein [Bacteroidia bacterium]|jgi:hypothetical protein